MDLALVVLVLSPLDLLALASVFFAVEDFFVAFFSAFGFSSLTLVLVFDVLAFLGASFLSALDFGELLVDADFLAFTFSSLVAASFLEVLSLDFFSAVFFVALFESLLDALADFFTLSSFFFAVFAVVFAVFFSSFSVVFFAATIVITLS